MLLDKSQIKRILRDHCLNSIKHKDGLGLIIDIDSIAQELIEHEKEIIIKKSFENKICAMIDKFLIKQSNKKKKCVCKQCL